MIYLDTHVALWLHDHEHGRLSPRARREVERSDLMVSPAVLLELQSLYEIKRLTTGASGIVSRLVREAGLRVCDLGFPSIVECALSQTWVRDPFDRLIVAHAHAARAALLTKDTLIRSHYRRAVW